MPSQYEQYRMTDGKTPLSERYFNRNWKSLDLRLTALEDVSAGVESVLNEVKQYGVLRLESQIQPLLTQISETLSTLSTDAETAVERIQKYYDDLSGGSIAGNLNVSGGLTVAGAIAASNLTAAKSGQQGLVRTDATVSDPIVYLKGSVDALLAVINSRLTTVENSNSAAAGLESRVNSLELQLSQTMAALDVIQESMGVYGAEYKTGTSTHSPPSGTAYWAGIIAYNDCVISTYAGINGFVAGMILKRGESIAVRTSSFRLTSGAVMALKGKPV